MLSRGLELWGGVECTLNRVGDRYFDQLCFNGHEERIEDLELFAKLGLKTLRYPFLWERKDNLSARGSWAERRLEKLKDLGIQPIIGFLHHGSGPPDTSLIDPQFPEKFAAYARSFIERFPYCELFTPINEPLTTARFSALYGFWYPHQKNTLLFARAFLNEIKATVLAFREIRRIQPRAQLIQTEDLGRATGTSNLQYQIDFENERRWLTFDLLCGRWSSKNLLWQYFEDNGISEKELSWFSENFIEPEVLGINHYPLSNRFLDSNLKAYPPAFHGGNNKDRYADVDAVRIGDFEPPSLLSLIEETWARFGRPIAITEVHINGPRVEQMRWLQQAWDTAVTARQKKISLRAVTAWGLLGHFDWDCLVTECRGNYEPGVFDLRAPTPRPTGLAKMVEHFSQKTSPFNHPVLSYPGWWKRDIRKIYRPANSKIEASFDFRNLSSSEKPLLIVGSNGTLARAFKRICDFRAIPYYSAGRPELEISDEESVTAIMKRISPWAVINCAGYVRVDEAEKDAHACWLCNVQGPLNLARIARSQGIPLVTFSSDLVFNGSQSEPYQESSPISPLNVYGRCKAEAEQKLLELYPEGTLIIRSAAFFGPWDSHNFLTINLERLARGEEVRAADDVIVTPTYVPDLVDATLDLLFDDERGLWHLTHGLPISWASFVKIAAERTGLNLRRIIPTSSVDIHRAAAQPKNSALVSERGWIMPAFENALDRFFDESLLLPKCRQSLCSSGTERVAP
jgi:dTDP-4-dehydrorhamnose reductase